MNTATETETAEQRAERLRFNAERRLAAKLSRWEALPDSAHVDVRVFSALCGWSIPTTWRRVRLKQIPAPVKLAPQVTRWTAGTVRKYLRDKQASAAGVAV